MGNEVLLDGPNSAMTFQNRNTTENDQLKYLTPWIANQNKIALERADQCSSLNATVDTCPYFIKTNLTLMIDDNANCPFDNRICRHNSGNLILDTGLSLAPTILMINAHQKDRISAQSGRFWNKYAS